MTRLLVHVEGQTEESFVNEVLKIHLCTQGFSKVDARLMGNSRQRYQRGGVGAWTSARKEITNHLNEDRGRIVTTMVDYYGMPQTGSRAWPDALKPMKSGFLTMRRRLKRRSHRISANRWGRTSTRSNSFRMS